MKKYAMIGAVGIASCLCPTESARATTYVSTKLSYVAEISRAVIQGELIGKTNLVDPEGVPWTIYTLSVARVLAGEVADKEFSFRCIGGSSGDRHLVMAGTPRLTVGDSIVAFLNESALCQFSVLEHGVLWLKRDSDGNERLVNQSGRVLAALGGDDVVLSTQILGV